MIEENNHYPSYLLRIWLVKLNSQLAWRASLETSSTGEKWGSAEIDELCACLHQHTRKRKDAETETGGDE